MALNPLDRICVSSWSFHNLFASTCDDKAHPPQRDYNVLEFPEMIADRYGVHNVEIVSKHFGSIEPSYLVEFRERLKRSQSRLVNIPIDIDELWDQPSISSPDPGTRDRAIGLYSPWIDRGAELGTRSVRCDPGILNLDDLSPTIESYKTLVARAEAWGIELTVENHGKASAHPHELVKILRESGAGALPDIGNFPDDETRDRGLREMFPLAKIACHAKLNPAKFDFAHCIQLSKEAGFTGFYSIEAGTASDPYDAVLQVIDALRICLAG
jgi:sugar phosphate isomerase/epimerase